VSALRQLVGRQESAQRSPDKGGLKDRLLRGGVTFKIAAVVPPPAESRSPSCFAKPPARTHRFIRPQTSDRPDQPRSRPPRWRRLSRLPCSASGCRGAIGARHRTAQVPARAARCVCRQRRGTNASGSPRGGPVWRILKGEALPGDDEEVESLPPNRWDPPDAVEDAKGGLTLAQRTRARESLRNVVPSAAQAACTRCILMMHDDD
jgi:hypothetical protein